MNKEFTVGQELEAIDECIMDDGGEKTLTIGKKYTINRIIDDKIVITDDCNDAHGFTIERIREYFKIPSEEIVLSKEETDSLIEGLKFQLSIITAQRDVIINQIKEYESRL